MSVYVRYNKMHNSIDIKWPDKTIIIIDCNKTEYF